MSEKERERLSMKKEDGNELRRAVEEWGEKKRVIKNERLIAHTLRSDDISKVK